MKKIALITGGSRGLGKDMALAFAKRNVDVIITYNSSEKEANEVIDQLLKEGIEAIALQFDISSTSNIDPFIATLKGELQRHWNTDAFDYLINNAGIGASIPMSSMTEEKFDQLMTIHYKGVYFLTQKLLPSMNDHGSVVFISSGTTRFCNPGYSVYSSLKSAIETVSKYVAMEYGTRGIRSNVVAPGPTETDFNSGMIRSNPHIKEMLSKKSPLGRVGQADDIGNVVAFICSDEAKWINGQRIEVSGGINL